MTWRIPLAFGLLLGAATAGSYVEIGTRAASLNVNCGCQCSSLTFRDDRGNIQGNCRRADETGAQWCYVSNWSSSCRDLQKSQRFKSHWSYEACSTPPSSLCGNGGNYELGASFGEGSNGRGTGTSRGQGSGFSGQGSGFLGQGSGFSWGSSGKGSIYGTSTIGQGSRFEDGSFGQSSGFLDSSFPDFESGPIGHGSYGQGSGSGSQYNGYLSGSGSYSQGIGSGINSQVSGSGLYSQGSGSGSYNQGSGSGSQSQGPGSNSGGPIVGLLNDILNGGVG